MSPGNTKKCITDLCACDDDFQKKLQREMVLQTFVFDDLFFNC